MSTHIHDLIGVGFGPANIAVAIALEELHGELDCIYFEQNEAPRWQEHMLLTGSDIQHHSLRGLATLRNPRSRFTFTNYLYESERLIEHLNLPTPFPLRTEYAQYISWVRENLETPVIYGVGVREIRYDQSAELYVVTTTEGREHLARQIAFAPGRSKRIPPEFTHLAGSNSNVFHLTDYLKKVEALDPHGQHRFAVIGGSQSAVELTLDIRSRFPHATTDLITRSWSLRSKDHSPFSEEIYFPAFTDYYHDATKSKRRRLDSFTRPTNYSAADLDVLEKLYVEIYEDRLLNKDRTRIHGDTTVNRAYPDLQNPKIRIATENITTGLNGIVRADFIILATGFRDMGPGPENEHHHRLLNGALDHFDVDADHDLVVNRDYSLRTRPGRGALYINGLCEAWHGIGDAGSFSLLSIRAGIIARAIVENQQRTSPEATPIVPAPPVYSAN